MKITSIMGASIKYKCINYKYIIKKIDHDDSLRARSTINSNIFKNESLFYYY